METISNHNTGGNVTIINKYFYTTDFAGLSNEQQQQQQQQQHNAPLLRRKKRSLKTNIGSSLDAGNKSKMLNNRVLEIVIFALLIILLLFMIVFNMLTLIADTLLFTFRLGHDICKRISSFIRKT